MKAITVETMRALDARAIAGGIPGYLLMERAGEGATRAILAYCRDRLAREHRERFTVLAGKGNNGGDAYVVARCLHAAGCRVCVHAVCPVDALTGDALAHARRLPAAVPLTMGDRLAAAALCAGTVVVDGLLGTGVTGALRPPYEALIRQVNDSGLPVIALDLPSGLNGNTGEPAELAVRADLTVTMGLPKAGLLTPAGMRHCGALRCIDIGLPAELTEAAEAAGPEAVFIEDAARLVVRRQPDAHKGTCGHVLVAGGSALYGGAPVLSAVAALRSGAGLVTVALPDGCTPLCAVPAAVIVRRVPPAGAGSFTAAGRDSLAELAAAASAFVFGPGSGPDPRTGDALARLLDTKLPAVIDADGLRRVAENPGLLARHAATVLTPHPGEMRVLQAAFNCPPSGGRPEQAAALAAACQAVVVLKGMGTVIAAPTGRTAINCSGSPALATAGSGDVLAGMIGALLGQGLPAWDAARLAVFVHGMAGELWPGAVCAMLADDLLEVLPRAWRAVSPAA